MSSNDVKLLLDRITLLEANLRTFGEVLGTLAKFADDARTELHVLHAKVSAAVSE